jgi:putative spermidine/putrescine transport system permease protein
MCAKKRISLVLLLLPILTFFIFFFLLPLIFMFVISLNKRVPGELLTTFSLETWSRLRSPAYLNAVLTTLKISAICSVVSLVIGYPAAYTMAKTGSHIMKKVFFVCIISSLFIGGISRVFSWILILGRNGVVNGTLTYFGILSEPLGLLYNESAVVIAAIHWILPFVILSLTGSIQSIDPSLEQAARNLGAGTTQVLTKITLPLSMPGILSASFLAFALSSSMFVVPLILGGGTVVMMGNLIYDSMVWGANFHLSSVLAFSLLIISLFVTYVLQHYVSKLIKVE